jgi:hypothetical protein
LGLNLPFAQLPARFPPALPVDIRLVVNQETLFRDQVVVLTCDFEIVDESTARGYLYLLDGLMAIYGEEGLAGLEGPGLQPTPFPIWSQAFRRVGCCRTLADGPSYISFPEIIEFQIMGLNGLREGSESARSLVRRFLNKKLQVVSFKILQIVMVKFLPDKVHVLNTEHASWLNTKASVS